MQIAGALAAPDGSVLALGNGDEVDDPAYFEDLDLRMVLLDRGLRTVYVPEVRVLHGGFSSGGEAAATVLIERNRPTFVARWGNRLAATHPPSLWPPDPKTRLAARDALATGRALVICDDLPAPADPGLGAAARGVLGELPWARITIAARAGDPEPWWRLGVEVLLHEDPTQVPTERPGHYDVIATPEEFTGPGTLATLRSAADRLEARIAEAR